MDGLSGPWMMDEGVAIAALGALAVLAIALLVFWRFVRRARRRSRSIAGLMMPPMVDQTAGHDNGASARGGTVVLFTPHPGAHDAAQLEPHEHVARTVHAHGVSAGHAGGSISPLHAVSVPQKTGGATTPTAPSTSASATSASATSPIPAAPRRRPRPANAIDETVVSPELLLARARSLLAAGAPEDAAAQLRLCVRLAGKLKQPLIEASARLELGDLAGAAGDLTTACEHWQMARALYADLKLASEGKAAEGRMERAHCPTDWVLTKF